MAQTFTHNLLHPRHWLTWSGLGLLWLLVQLPYPVLHILGSGLGKISRPFLKRREGIAIRNIELCFPEMTPFARSQMVNKNFVSLGLGLMEWNNPATMGGLSVPGKVMASLFQSVSTRTAGMNTVDLASCGTLSKLLMSVLQFIGAAPGSTGGGVKVTTFAVIILTIRSVAQGRDDCVIADHHIESKTVYRALTIIVLGAAAVIGSAIVVYYNTSDAVSVVDAIFESCSAFGTVGLSVGVTSQLNNGAKILYMLVMFMGRVGPVAFAMSLTAKPDDNKRKIMPVGHINVG